MIVIAKVNKKLSNFLNLTYINIFAEVCNDRKLHRKNAQKILCDEHSLIRVDFIDDFFDGVAVGNPVGVVGRFTWHYKRSYRK